jgi:hypothetical protein
MWSMFEQKNRGQKRNRQNCATATIAICLVVILFPLLCYAQTSMKPPVATPASAKVQSILQRLLRGDSAYELRRAVEDAHLTDVEKKQIRTALSKPEYKAMIEALKRSEGASRPGRPVAQIHQQGEPVDQLRHRLNQEMRQYVQTLNRQAAEGLQNAKNQVRVAMSRPPAQSTIPKPQTQAVTPASPPGVVTAKGAIRSVEPMKPVVGRSLTIHGSQFGAYDGTVKILFKRGPSGHSVYLCVVTTWSDTAINVMVPTGIEDIFHYYGGFNDGIEPATLVVVPRGVDLGAGRDLTVALDPDRIVPDVYATSPSQITPGSRVVLTGRNLSVVGAPVVTARFNDRQRHYVQVTVRDYNQNWIEASLPEDLSGIPQSEVAFEVHNGLSKRQSPAIRFIPAEEIREEVTWVEADSWDHSFIFCFDYDESREITLDVGNGWRLERFNYPSPYQEGRALNRVGCYWSRPPAQPPSGHISGVGVAWAENCRQIVCDFRLILRGPRGVPYRYR